MLDSLDASKLELNGVRYHVRDSQTGKETVLLLHGWPDDGTVWQKQIPALVDAGYRVICPDLPGYGLSEAPTETERYQLTNLVTDLVILLEHLNLEKVHCIAHDYGAVLGWELASNTTLLKTYIAMSVGHLAEFLTVSLENLQYQWIYFLNIQDIAPQLYLANNGYLFREVLRSHPYGDRLVENALKSEMFVNMQRLEKANPVPEYLLAALTGQLPEPNWGIPVTAEVGPRGIFNPQGNADLRTVVLRRCNGDSIDIPTMGIWSERDEFLWESQMKNSGKYISAEWQYTRIEQAGHWFMLEQPDKTNQLLLSWLAKHL